ncbi:MAG: hypothetical protein HXY47_03550 [Nitrospirae bacterium]|nr:hypothetical protein [Nitrospirota bacterium]
MEKKMNLIMDAWNRSSSKERELFLRELHERYGFERLCIALSLVTDCEIRGGILNRLTGMRTQHFS